MRSSLLETFPRSSAQWYSTSWSGCVGSSKFAKLFPALLPLRADLLEVTVWVWRLAINYSNQRKQAIDLNCGACHALTFLSHDDEIYFLQICTNAEWWRRACLLSQSKKATANEMPIIKRDWETFLRQTPYLRTTRSFMCGVAVHQRVVCTNLVLAKLDFLHTWRQMSAAFRRSVIQICKAWVTYNR